MFQDLTVVVLGAASSGTDIGLEIARVAKKVYLCHNNPPIPSSLPPSMEQRTGIGKVRGKEIELSDMTILHDIDVLLFCTGYHYSFPFLDASCHPKIENHVVSPLFKHMIHIEHPTLCFIGIPEKICPFPLFHLQVQFFVKSLTGHYILPSREDMLRDTANEKAAKQSKGIAEKHFHRLGAAQWDYNRSLCQMAGLAGIPTVVEKLYNDVWERRRYNLTIYKEDAYKLLTEDAYQVIKR